MSCIGRLLTYTTHTLTLICILKLKGVTLSVTYIKTISNPSYSISTKNGNGFWIFISNSNMKGNSVSATSSSYMSLHECNCKMCESSFTFHS